MKRGTKIGWFLIALSVILSVWVIVSQSSDASQATESGLVLSDDGTVLEDYTGNGGAVTIPDGVTTINAGVFASKNITSVVMPSSVTSMGTGVFSGCTSLASVSLSSSLNGIPEETFRECLSLGSVTIPDSATSIGSNAFYGCASLSSVSIPASVSRISTDAFSGCGNLSNISVASGNGAYASSDGCLYNASKTRLLLVPEGKTSLAIAAGTTTIGTGAGISTVSLPNSVTTIEANAFTDSGVETITIPASVTSIAAQSSWTPSTIYGVSDSAAEKYAKDNNIVFVVLGDNQDNDNNDDNNDDNNNNNNGGNTNGDNNGNNNGANNGDNGSNNGTSDGDVVNPDGSITHADGSVTTADGRVIKSATNGGTASHTKDATPTTADGIDPRYFLCIAIFAGGIGVILYSRFNKMKYLSQNHKDRS